MATPLFWVRIAIDRQNPPKVMEEAPEADFLGEPELISAFLASGQVGQETLHLCHFTPGDLSGSWSGLKK